MSQEVKSKTLIYKGITFKAENTSDKPYHVSAAKDGRVIWEINNDTVSPERQNPDLKDGGIDKLVIQKVKDGDLDQGAGNYPQMKEYIGKPALYIYYSKYSVVNRLPSWCIVDPDTGKMISFIGFN